MNICSTFLSRPARSGKKHSLSLIIRRRFNESDDHNIDLSANSHQVSKHHKSNSLANMVSAKMEDGDMSAATRLLCSNDKPIFDSAEVFEKLTERHPLAAEDMQHLEDPALTTALQVLDKEVSKAILSFLAGSSGGPDASVQNISLISLIARLQDETFYPRLPLLQTCYWMANVTLPSDPFC